MDPSLSLDGLHDAEARGDGIDAELHQELELVRGEKARHPLDDRRSGRVRLRPVCVANGVDKGLDVLPVLVEVCRRDGSAVSDVKGCVSGQLPPETLEVGQPLVEETVGEIGVLPVVHLVAEEHR